MTELSTRNGGLFVVLLIVIWLGNRIDFLVIFRVILLDWTITNLLLYWSML